MTKSKLLNQCFVFTLIWGCVWDLRLGHLWLSSSLQFSDSTRTTRTPAFWDTPTAPWLPILVVHIRSKQDKVKVTKFKKIAKNSNFEILQETLNAAHLLKLLDKMYKYEMDPTRTAGTTERTRDVGRTDGRTEWNQYTPQQLRCVAGIIIWDC